MARVSIKGLPVVTITGDELGENKTYKEWIDAFKKYFDKNIAHKPVFSLVLGKVEIFSSAKNETIFRNRKTVENLKFLPAIPKIIEKSQIVLDEPLKHEKRDVIRAWRVFGVVVDKKEKQYARLIKITVLEDKKHNKYYTFDARIKISL